MLLCIKSHPNKLLIDHIDGVKKIALSLNNNKYLELVVLFHDLGKINKNFQSKLNGDIVNAYSDHSYISAIIFLIFIKSKYCKYSDVVLTKEDILLLIMIIAKHHGDLSNMVKENSFNYTTYFFLSEKKFKESLNFFSENYSIKFSGLDNFLIHYFGSDSSYKALPNLIENFKKIDLQKDLNFNEENIKFQDKLYKFIEFKQFFSNLVFADKLDASGNNDLLKIDNENIEKFCGLFNYNLNNKISKFSFNTELDKKRNDIRSNVINNIINELKENNYKFELTAPTGSGKTIMLLSIANEIIKFKGTKRIFYILPFLSILEQVEKELLSIFDKDEFIGRIDSKTVYKELEHFINDENYTSKNINKLQFLLLKHNTFFYPFILISFVTFFETIFTNKNNELLKLSNFQNSIFLIDEIQTLPPRLYSFFIGYLDIFCKKNNSFLVISSATQPNYNLPENIEINNSSQKSKDFFIGYVPPISLLNTNYFKENVFNRYILLNESNSTITFDSLLKKIVDIEKTILVILNTINDSKILFNKLKNLKLKNREIFLLNTHLTPRDRSLKIYLIKRKLKLGFKIILISTQLIEAGVDIDFEVVIRDYCPMPNIIQSAGRCNRNAKMMEKGLLYLIKLIGENNECRYKFIYKGKDEELINFTKQVLNSKGSFEEVELIELQKTYFDKINQQLNFAYHQSKNEEYNFLNIINEFQYEKLGRFKLIDDELNLLKLYINKNNKDNSFNDLDKLINELNQTDINLSFDNKKIIKIKIENILKKMANNTIQIRIKKDILINFKYPKPLLGIYHLSDEFYNFEEGFNTSEVCII